MRLFPDSEPLETSLVTQVWLVIHFCVKQYEHLPLDIEVFEETCLFEQYFSLSDPE